MNLSQALRLSSTTCLALTGAGGKTTALFQIAREIAPTLVTVTTHLGTWQVKNADRHIIWTAEDELPDLEAMPKMGVTVISGPPDQDNERFSGLSREQVNTIAGLAKTRNLPLLIEADGARQRPLKAPNENEPVVPETASTVVVSAGLSALGKPLTAEYVHRPDVYAKISGMLKGDTITAQAVAKALTHPQGGLKGIPQAARRVLLLNQADNEELQSQAKRIAREALAHFSAVIIAALQNKKPICAVQEHIAGIILAAGESQRFGQPKQLLDWHGKPFVYHVAKNAMAAGLHPVIVVTGAQAEAVETALTGLEVLTTRNAKWHNGQSTSIQAGLKCLPQETGAAIFLLADQPQIPRTILNALMECHSQTLAPLIAPLVGGQRANPVLFDRTVFGDLLKITGDMGGRAVFGQHRIEYLTWFDGSLLVDIDTPQDYEDFLNAC